MKWAHESALAFDDRAIPRRARGMATPTTTPRVGAANGRAAIAAALALALSARLAWQKWEHDAVVMTMREELAREREARTACEGRGWFARRGARGAGAARGRGGGGGRGSGMY